MKKINFALGIGIGFVALAVVSLFFNIPVQVITTLSICSLFLTIAQTIQSFIDVRDKEEQQKFDCFKDFGNFQIDKKWDYLYKKYLHIWTDNKRVKVIKITSNVLEIASIVVLILGLSIPLNFFEQEWVSNFCALLSFALLFFNIWLVGIVKNRIELWNEVRVINMLLKDNAPDNKEINKQPNGQNDDVQP